MNLRKVMIGLMAAALVGSFGAAAQTTFGSATSALTPGEDTTDEIVEQHTVYTTIEDQAGGANAQAAIAVLIENKSVSNQGAVFWFDDSFLHAGQQQAELACGGSLWATHSQGVLLDPSQYTEDKTYQITSPAENNAGTVTWTITEFEGPDNTQLTRAWAVEVDCFAQDPDEGYSTGPFPTYCDANGGVDDCTVDGDPATDANSPSDVGTLEYNALLWFEFGFGHLEFPYGTEEHGCEDGNTGQEACGADAETADTTEGNSHPYNPQATSSAEIHTHNTAQIDLYYEEIDNVAHGSVDFQNNLQNATYHQH